MASVYLVTSGQYSDYRVEAAFSTREIADAFAAELNKTDDDGAKVEEMPLDERRGQAARRVWSLYIDLESGDVTSEDDDVVLRDAGDACEIRPWSDSIRRVESPVSAEHAAKVAAEYRQRWLRERAMMD